MNLFTTKMKKNFFNGIDFRTNKTKSIKQNQKIILIYKKIAQ